MRVKATPSTTAKPQTSSTARPVSVGTHRALGAVTGSQWAHLPRVGGTIDRFTDSPPPDGPPNTCRGAQPCAPVCNHGPTNLPTTAASGQEPSIYLVRSLSPVPQSRNLGPLGSQPSPKTSSNPGPFKSSLSLWERVRVRASLVRCKAANALDLPSPSPPFWR